MKKILFYNSGGGLGDSIQLFPLILSLKNYFNNSEFYYLGAHENHFENKLKDYNINLKTLNLNLKYFGFRIWHFFFVKKNFNKTNINKFVLIIDLQYKLRNTLILKKIPHIDFYSSTLNFTFCSKQKGFFSKNHIYNLSKFLDINIKEISYDLNLIPQKYIEESNKILTGKNYIGFSLTQGNNYRKKSWSINKFVELAKCFERREKKIVFFVEKNNLNLINYLRKNIPNAIFPESMSKLNGPTFVTALATKLEMAISIDNGIMHMINLAKIPMIVLFGPTDSKKFAPKRENVIIIDSKIIKKTKDINSISVDDVFYSSKLN